MKEIATQILQKLPKQTLVSLVIILGFIWANDRVKKNAEKQDIMIENDANLKNEMHNGFNNIYKELNVVKNDISGVKTDISEQKQVTKIVVDQSSEVVKQAARQTQEIYNQMKRDQSRKDRQISNDESYIPEKIDPVEKELQTYIPDPEFKKKLQ